MSPKTNSNARKKQKPENKKNSRWWQWLVFAVLIVIIITLLILVLNKPKTEKELSICEKANDSCFSGACPSGSTKLNLNCSKEGDICCKENIKENLCEKYGSDCFNEACPTGTTNINLECVNSGDVCCKKIVGYQEQTTCEKQNDLCLVASSPQTSCPPGWPIIGLACRPGEICCQELKSQNNTITLSGYVKLKQGNCLPPVGPGCKEEYIDTEIALFGRTYQSAMEGNYYTPAIGPITFGNSNENGVPGYYLLKIQPGEYSFFVKDPLHNNDYYCNQIDAKGNVCYINISRSQTISIVIDHSTH